MTGVLTHLFQVGESVEEGAEDEDALALEGVGGGAAGLCRDGDNHDCVARRKRAKGMLINFFKGVNSNVWMYEN